MPSIRSVFRVLWSTSLVLLLAGCVPWWSSRSAPPPDRHRICFDAGCETTDCAGTVDELIEVERGDIVTFCNQAECVIKVHFEKRELFARDWLTLLPGECVDLRVMSAVEDGSYVLEIYGDCCPATGIGNPEVKVGGGDG